MTESRAIIGLAPWFGTPLGRYLLDWEQSQLDRVVADLFGFHALQLGMPELQGLASNRMPHRWLATVGLSELAAEASAGSAAPALCCDLDALPFDSQSLDLVVLPHTLELARDPHLALGEVERVLRPEGRVVILGFNPVSLWGLRRQVQRVAGRMGGSDAPYTLPDLAEPIGPRRVRDWLRLLSFEVETARFGCYRPPVSSERWLERTAWMEGGGARWWPVFGGMYLLVAVKRVRGMRLVGLTRAARSKSAAAPAIIAQRRRP